MNKTIKNQVQEGNVSEWKEIDNRQVTERIKTFEDAVKSTGMTLQLDDNQLSCLPKDVVAYMKLRIIAAALNELHEATLDEFPKLTSDEYRYYPWFYLYKQGKKKKRYRFGGTSSDGSACGLASALSHGAWSYSDTSIPGRLAVKSQKLAFYFGTQFIDIWADYLT